MANLLPKLLTSFSRLSIRNIQHVNKSPIYYNKLFALSNLKFSTQPTPYEIVDEKYEEKRQTEIVDKINKQIKQKQEGRLFAIVHLASKQIRITEGDVLIVEGFWPPECGDRISLDKVMLVGSENFTLIGRPIVQKGLVNIEATVIEKTLSHTKILFKKRRRKQYVRANFYRYSQTFLRINTIKINGELNNPPEVRGLEKAIF